MPKYGSFTSAFNENAVVATITGGTGSTGNVPQITSNGQLEDSGFPMSSLTGSSGGGSSLYDQEYYLNSTAAGGGDGSEATPFKTMAELFSGITWGAENVRVFVTGTISDNITATDSHTGKLVFQGVSVDGGSHNRATLASLISVADGVTLSAMIFYNLHMKVPTTETTTGIAANLKFTQCQFITSPSTDILTNGSLEIYNCKIGGGGTVTFTNTAMFALSVTIDGFWSEGDDTVGLHIIGEVGKKIFRAFVDNTYGVGLTLQFDYFNTMYLNDVNVVALNGAGSNVVHAYNCDTVAADLGNAVILNGRLVNVYRDNTADPVSATANAQFGYGTGSVWVNDSTEATFMCTDNHPTSAPWAPIGTGVIV